MCLFILHVLGPYLSCSRVHSLCPKIPSLRCICHVDATAPLKILLVRARHGFRPPRNVLNTKMPSISQLKNDSKEGWQHTITLSKSMQPIGLGWRTHRKSKLQFQNILLFFLEALHILKVGGRMSYTYRVSAPTLENIFRRPCLTLVPFEN